MTTTEASTVVRGRRARALHHDLRLVQYDFSVGERYVTGEMFHPPP